MLYGHNSSNIQAQFVAERRVTGAHQRCSSYWILKRVRGTTFIIIFTHTAVGSSGPQTIRSKANSQVLLQMKRRENCVDCCLFSLKMFCFALFYIIINRTSCWKKQDTEDILWTDPCKLKMCVRAGGLRAELLCQQTTRGENNKWKKTLNVIGLSSASITAWAFTLSNQNLHLYMSLLILVLWCRYIHVSWHAWQNHIRDHRRSIAKN